ncbi:hypothetical protein R1flu_012522 [Riccia fluitans]|uniref:Uncharacterized protein n=1 Tax=Riccia fluitans TaxID=41844 RepID=A0ABD1ZB09_9MARC
MVIGIKPSKVGLGFERVDCQENIIRAWVRLCRSEGLHVLWLKEGSIHQGERVSHGSSSANSFVSGNRLWHGTDDWIGFVNAFSYEKLSVMTATEDRKSTWFRLCRSHNLPMITCNSRLTTANASNRKRQSESGYGRAAPAAQHWQTHNVMIKFAFQHPDELRIDLQ